ncbi:hypothetical protein BX666DRAFT_1877156 [Dichotomocladium elegans]|nr:hypothetical protein BX666DRAFT_1877156 [Dichotomocladium elegans]
MDNKNNAKAPEAQTLAQALRPSIVLPSIHTLLRHSLPRRRRQQQQQQQPVPSPHPTRATVMNIGMITHMTDREPLERSRARKASPTAAQESGSNKQRITKRRCAVRQSTGSSHSNTSDISACSSVAVQSRSSTIARLVRPRWQPRERLNLLLAVVEDKQLDDMAAFDWNTVAFKVGRSRKACKDQWRREIFRSIIDHFTMLATE